MKKFLLLAAGVLATLTSMVSCNSDPVDAPIVMLVTTKGNSSDYHFENDIHKTFYISNKNEALAIYRPKDGQRSYILFSENAEKFPGYDYTIYLQQVLPLYTSKAVEVTTQAQWDELIKNADKIHYSDGGDRTAYLSEDYLTLNIVRRASDTKKHKYHLVVDKLNPAVDGTTPEYVDVKLLHQNEGDLDVGTGNEVISFDIEVLKKDLAAENVKGIRLIFDSYDGKQQTALIQKAKSTAPVMTPAAL